MGNLTARYVTLKPSGDRRDALSDSGTRQGDVAGDADLSRLIGGNGRPRASQGGCGGFGGEVQEEPDAPIYDECMLRLMTTDGLMLCTFTPLLGLTEIALRFLPDLAPVLETGNVR